MAASGLFGAIGAVAIEILFWSDRQKQGKAADAGLL